MEKREITDILPEREYEMVIFYPRYYNNNVTGEKEVSSHNHYTTISSEHITTLVGVAKMLEAKWWEIFKQDEKRWGRTKVSVSPALRHHRTLEKKKIEDRHRLKNEAVERINKIVPKNYTLEDEDTDTVLVTIERNDATYKPEHSSKISCTIKVNYCERGRSVFGMTDYVRNDGGLMIKKFSDDMEWLFGKENCHFLEPKPTLKEIVRLYNKMKSAIKDASKGTWHDGNR